LIQRRQSAQNLPSKTRLNETRAIAIETLSLGTASVTLKAVKVRLLFFGIASEIAEASEDTVSLSPSATIEDLLATYLRLKPELESIAPSLIFARNQEFVSRKTTLNEGDEVAFLPPVSGGTVSTSSTGYENCSTYREISTQTIDQQRLIDFVNQPTNGAIALFLGVVRNHSQGRITRYLDYQCYEPMALKVLDKLCAEIRNEFPIDRIAIQHRTGRVEITEASVAVAVSSPHRKAAFDACFAAINRLKTTLPVWKREYFEDGEIWVEGAWDDSLRQLQQS
jgi:MoaE-MoaD fusion protein